VRLFIRIHEVARHHRSVNFFIIKAEWNHLIIARLQVHGRKVNGVTENARRSSRLQASGGKAKTIQTLRQTKCAAFTNTTARCIILANKNPPAQERARGKHNRAHRYHTTALRHHANHFLPHAALCSVRCIFVRRRSALFTRYRSHCRRAVAPFRKRRTACYREHIDRSVHKRRKIRRCLKRVTCKLRIHNLVCLRTRSLYCRPPAFVEHTELNHGAVSKLCHLAAERIYFANNISLRNAAN